LHDVKGIDISPHILLKILSFFTKRIHRGILLKLYEENRMCGLFAFDWMNLQLPYCGNSNIKPLIKKEEKYFSRK